jgi:hypothetical protein
MPSTGACGRRREHESHGRVVYLKGPESGPDSAGYRTELNQLLIGYAPRLHTTLRGGHREETGMA